MLKVLIPYKLRLWQVKYNITFSELLMFLENSVFFSVFLEGVSWPRRVIAFFSVFLCILFYDERGGGASTTPCTSLPVPMRPVTERTTKTFFLETAETHNLGILTYCATSICTTFFRFPF